MGYESRVYAMNRTEYNGHVFGCELARFEVFAWPYSEMVEEDGAYLARAWAEGRERLDGWQLEYAGRVYGVQRVPGCTLRRCVVWSEGGKTCFERGTRARERMTVWKYYDRLKQAIRAN